MAIGTTITPERFQTLLDEVIAECDRRKYSTSMVSYADVGRTAKAGNQFSSGSKISKEVYRAIETPMNVINDENPVDSNQDVIVAEDTLANMEANVAVYKTYPVMGTQTGCQGACIGLCYATCTGGCQSGCSGSCGGACSSSCTGGCSGCTGCTGCSGGCSGRCSGGCKGCTSCSGCSGGCKGGCSGGCTGCGGSCTGGCSSCRGCSSGVGRGSSTTL